MNESERHARIKFLWERLRNVVRHKGFLTRLLEEALKNERDRFGLEYDFIRVIEPEKEIEALLPI